MSAIHNEFNLRSIQHRQCKIVNLFGITLPLMGLAEPISQNYRSTKSMKYCFKATGCLKEDYEMR